MRPIYVAYIFLLLSGFAFFLYLDDIDTLIIYDDLYSENLIKYSFREIVSITASDVHPPLYYWGLKSYTSLLGNSTFVLRSFSALGMLSVLLLGLFPIRRLFGDKTAFTFIILTIIFPVTQYLVTDIRMYSWTMFSVLACALFALDVYQKGRRVDWIKFFITGLCAAYLHNYGLISVFWIYIILLVFLFYKRKNWQYLLVCGFLFSVFYFPWLLQLIAQVSSVSNSYWIKPLTLNDLFLHIYYFYSPKEVWFPFVYFTKLQMMVALIALMSVQLFISMAVLIKKIKYKSKTTLLALIFFIAFLLPVVTGFIYSIVSTPIIVTRYMTCMFGLFILSLSLLISKSYQFPFLRYCSYLFLMLLLIDGSVRFYTNKKYYQSEDENYRQIVSFLNEGQEKKIIAFPSSYYLLPIIQKLKPNCEYCVLIDTIDANIDYKSFDLKCLPEKPLDSTLILVSRRIKGVDTNNNDIRSLLSDGYIVTGNFTDSGFFLYRIEKK